MPFLPLTDDNPRILIGRPWVTWGVIAACVVVFLLQALAGPVGGQRLLIGLGLIPASLTGLAELRPELALLPPVATLVTSMFLHGGLMHLLGNMLFLWVFGDNIEDAMGHARFVGFYLLCGVAAALTHVAVAPATPVPMVGASGAISGVLGAYLLLYPKARVAVLILYLPFAFPAYVLLLLWIGFQLLAAGGGGQPGVAWYAHIGGFFAGMALVVPLRHRAVPLFGGGTHPKGLRLRRPPSRRPNDPGGPWQR